MGPKPKKNPPRQAYSEATLTAAVRAVKVDKVPKRVAAKWFGIPRTTLRNAVGGVYQAEDLLTEAEVETEED